MASPFNMAESAAHDTAAHDTITLVSSVLGFPLLPGRREVHRPGTGVVKESRIRVPANGGAPSEAQGGHREPVIE